MAERLTAGDFGCPVSTTGRHMLDAEGWCVECNYRPEPDEDAPDRATPEAATGDPLERFEADMANAGLRVRHYHGRYFWHGPAVAVDDLQDALSETKVPCQWDNLGRGWIVYPKTSDPSPVRECSR